MSRYANRYINYNEQQINISYNELNSIEQIDHPNLSSVKKLSLIHCNLQSLKGIEKFTELVSLNLKFNNLQMPEEILRISNKQLLKQLNLQGNTIQYYSLCTFMSLRAHGFRNLTFLNNKDYSKWGKNKKKAPRMKTINENLKQIQKSMSKTLKRTIKSNVFEKQKFISNIIQPDQEQTSRHSSDAIDIHQISKNPLRQISLSNVNMIKSQRANNMVEVQQKYKGPQLTIDPIDYDENKISHIPLTQPTATFAVQKQRQSLGMPFRKTNKIERSLINAVQEQYQNYPNDDDQDLYQLSQNLNLLQRQSFSRTKTNGFLTVNGNMQNKSGFYDLYDQTVCMQQTVAQANYVKKLGLKVFKALKSLLNSRSKSFDMPCQRKYE